MGGGGRMLLGIGVSGPQIVEGWYGEPWGRPYYRLRDYVAIIRKIWAREAPVTHAGEEISLPYQGPGAAGLAEAWKKDWIVLAQSSDDMTFDVRHIRSIRYTNTMGADVKLAQDLSNALIALGYRQSGVSPPARS